MSNNNWCKSKWLFNDDGTVTGGGYWNINAKPVCEWAVKYFNDECTMIEPTIFPTELVDRYNRIYVATNSNYMWSIVRRCDLVVILYEEWKKNK